MPTVTDARMAPVVDDFQRAVAAAQAEASDWSGLPPAARTRAIYAQLRRLDIARAKAIGFMPGRPGRFGVAGALMKRKARA